jgi:hypothetical protein
MSCSLPSQYCCILLKCVCESCGLVLLFVTSHVSPPVPEFHLITWCRKILWTRAKGRRPNLFWAFSAREGQVQRPDCQIPAAKAEGRHPQIVARQGQGPDLSKKVGPFTPAANSLLPPKLLSLEWSRTMYSFCPIIYLSSVRIGSWPTDAKMNCFQRDTEASWYQWLQLHYIIRKVGAMHPFRSNSWHSRPRQSYSPSACDLFKPQSWMAVWTFRMTIQRVRTTESSTTRCICTTEHQTPPPVMEMECNIVQEWVDKENWPTSCT